MPLYDYECSQCHKVVEVRHGFDETHTQPCPDCGGELRRVFNPAPILFKGSGFYVTDSRKPEGTKESSSKDASSGSGSSSKDSAA